MAKITFTNILTGFRTAVGLNTNFQDIATELNDKVLYRDPPGGEENTMKTTLDMNSEQIINLPIATLPTEAARFSQISSLIAGSSIPTQDEGNTIVQTPSKLNFVGTGVTVTAVSGDVSTITIPTASTPVQEEGTEITAAPTAINFKGSGVTVTDVSGVATVTIASDFLSLTDVPSSYTGQANKVVSVNVGETALEFTTPVAGGAFQGAYATLSANIALSAGSTVIPWGAETYDTDSFHDNSTNNSRLTIPSGEGITKVMLVFNGDFNTPSTGQILVQIRLNGTTNIAGTSITAFTGSELLSVSTGPFAVSDSDYFEVTIFVNFTGQLDNVTGSNFSIYVVD